MNNFVCCCECEYQEICFKCDPFNGCNNGKQIENHLNSQEFKLNNISNKDPYYADEKIAKVVDNLIFYS